MYAILKCVHSINVICTMYIFRGFDSAQDDDGDPGPSSRGVTVNKLFNAQVCGDHQLLSGLWRALFNTFSFSYSHIASCDRLLVKCSCVFVISLQRPARKRKGGSEDGMAMEVEEDVAGSDKGKGPALPENAANAASNKLLSKLESDFECVVCRELLVAAHSVIPCGHTFCGEVSHTLLQQDDSR